MTVFTADRIVHVSTDPDAVEHYREHLSPRAHLLRSTIRLEPCGMGGRLRGRGVAHRHPAEQVNRWSLTGFGYDRWSLTGFGYDGINGSIVIRAAGERAGEPEGCNRCNGHGSIERYPGQRAEADAWERVDPPQGEGWQLWETVSEGSPISPVFATADELAAWMSRPERGRDWLPPQAASACIAEGWAPTGVITPEIGVVSGAEYVGHHAPKTGADA